MQLPDDSRVLISIDPGKQGAVVLRITGGFTPLCLRLPETCRELNNLITELLLPKKYLPILQDPNRTYAIIERTGTYRPGNSAVAATTFARHCGRLEQAFISNGIQLYSTAPQVWMSYYKDLMGIDWSTGSGDAATEKKERKHAILNSVRSKFPSNSFALWNSDAVALNITLEHFINYSILSRNNVCSLVQ